MDKSIFENMFSDEPYSKINTETCLTNYYKAQGFNQFKSAEYAQNNIINFVEFVNRLISESNKSNVCCLFLSATKDVVYINPDYFVVKKIHSNLTKIEWRDFELISSIILEVCFGAIDVKTTQASADGGLDFEGKIPIKSKLSNNTYGYIEVYGQSKKYSGNVGIEDIRSFVGVANAKKRNFVHPTQLFLYFTTSDYAKSSQDELFQNHFIGLSGIQLANLIFLHKELLSLKSEVLEKMVTI